MRDFAEETEMLSVIDDEGHLYDYASEKLAAVRREMRGLKIRCAARATRC